MMHGKPERPLTLHGDLHNLPAALDPLKALPHWVCWRWEWRVNKKGICKWTKPPLQPNNPQQYAKNNDPATWGSYEQALAVFEASKCDGIGFCLLGTDIGAFDLDNSRDPATGEIAPEAMRYVDRAASYSEISVSGTGLHVIGYGVGAKVHRKQKLPGSPVEVESYRGAERYIVVTGNPLPGILDKWPHMVDIGDEVDAVVAELDGLKGEPEQTVDLKQQARQDKQADLDDEFAFTPQAGTGPGSDGFGDTFLPDGLIELIDNGVAPQNDLSAAFHHAVCWLHDCGWLADRIERRIAGKPIVPARYAKRLAGEIARCLHKAKGKADDGRGAELAAQLLGGSGAGGAGASTGANSAGSATGGTTSAVDPIEPVDLWAKFDPPNLPRGVLPAVIEEFAIDRGMTMGCDMSGVAVGALAVCAGAIPDDIKLQPKKNDTEWQEAPRLWVLQIGDPSTMKTPSISAATKPLRRIDSELARDYQDALDDWLSLEKEVQRTTPRPKKLRAMIFDTTIESTQEILKDSPNGVLLEDDELSGWFDAMYKYSGGRGAQKDRSFWLQAYNGGPKTVDRIVRGSVHIPNLSVSIIGGSRPGPIRKLADAGEDDGLLQRFLPIMARPAVGGRDEAPGEAVFNYADLIRNLYELKPPQSGIIFPALAGLTFDDGARKIREELEKRHLNLMLLEGLNRKLTAHFGKYNGIFARLCVVFHCIEHAKDDVLPAVIPEATAKRVANFLHGFLLRHAVAFYVGVLGLANDHDRLANVADYVLAHGLERITNRDVQRGDQSMRGLKRFETEAIFEQLEALGWVTRTPGPRPSDPSHWIVNPVVHQKFAERVKASKERRARGREMAVAISQAIKSSKEG